MSHITLYKESTPTPEHLVWENPPEKPRTGKYAGIAAALKQRANDWAVLATFTAEKKARAWHLSNSINTAKPIDFKPTETGHFEAVTRTIGDTSRVYIRFTTTAKENAR